MSNEDFLLNACDYCGKGVWQKDAFFKCQEDECKNDEEIIYCKDCAKRCDKCYKFFCLEHIKEHKEDCGEE